MYKRKHGTGSENLAHCKYSRYFAQDCIACSELVNNDDVRRIKEGQEQYADECSRLCGIDISTELYLRVGYDP